MGMRVEPVIAWLILCKRGGREIPLDNGGFPNRRPVPFIGTADQARYEAARRGMAWEYMTGQKADQLVFVPADEAERYAA